VSARIDRLVTSGQFRLDGGVWDVDTNVWIVGDDDECMVIDAAHDQDLIAAAVGARNVTAILCTHGHNDHVNAAVGLAEYTGAPILLHPADRVLWEQTHPDRAPDHALADGQQLTVAGVELDVLHTPGHAPGACGFHVPELGALFSGDTLVLGGPGATGRSYSDFDTIIASIRTKLLVLPAETVVYTGHGEITTIGAEAPHLDEWIARGH
jgi:glyoxylase-like metal-dependent hydrolase (beta-lactamase superfamily II)